MGEIGIVFMTRLFNNIIKQKVGWMSEGKEPIYIRIKDIFKFHKISLY